MNKIELESKLQAEGLMFVYDRGSKKQYINGNNIFKNGVFHNCPNVFGIYEWDANNFVCFITDDERGIPYYTDIHKTIEDACMALYDWVKNLHYIHNKNNKPDDFGSF
jgi:hypothetical protein